MLEERTLLVASIDDFELLNDTGESNTDLVTADPRVTGVVNGDFTTGHVELEFDHYADGSATFTWRRWARSAAPVSAGTPAYGLGPTEVSPRWTLRPATVKSLS